MENPGMPAIKVLFYITLVFSCLLPLTASAFYKLSNQQPQDSAKTGKSLQKQMSVGTSTSGAPATLPTAQAAPTPETSNKVQVLGIKVGGMFDNAIPQNRVVVNDKILILVKNPKGLLALKPSDQSKLILYADQLPLKGISTTYFTQLGKNDINDIIWQDTVWIPFIFSRDSTSTEAWNTLFRVTKWNRNVTRFHLSLGWEGMYPIPYGNKETSARVFELVLYNNKIFWVLLGCYLGFIVFFIRLCHSTGLIREPDIVPTGLGPFSLAQTQLAFWTVIIIGGFIYLTILTGLPNSLNDSSLLLLGITGGTTGVAGFIDYFKKEGKTGTKPVSYNPNSPAFVKPKRGFLRDISSDGVNLNVQRAQTIMWNLVLGVYFIWYVVSNKAMPVFSNTLLTLAGVSSLVYLSSKGPEKPTAAPASDAGGSKESDQEAAAGTT
jgi:hypothetical protein